MIVVLGLYELTVDDKLQYGQKNAQGDMRFVVYHDKGRKLYQVRQRSLLPLPVF